MFRSYRASRVERARIAAAAPPLKPGVRLHYIARWYGQRLHAVPLQSKHHVRSIKIPHEPLRTHTDNRQGFLSRPRCSRKTKSNLLLSCYGADRRSAHKCTEFYALRTWCDGIAHDSMQHILYVQYIVVSSLKMDHVCTVMGATLS